MSARPRVVVASPDREEVALLADWLLGEGLDPVPVRSLPSAIEEVQSHTYDVLIADARFAFEGRLHGIARSRNTRAPLVVIGGDEETIAAERMGTFHVRRPLDQMLLLCHVAMAIIEGRPARRSARTRIAAIEAMVEGAPAHILDVSNEGLRFQLPRGRTAPPPQFTVRIPLLGLALTARRVWVSSTPTQHADGSWCGAELFQCHPRAAQHWRAFVDTMGTAR